MKSLDLLLKGAQGLRTFATRVAVLVCIGALLVSPDLVSAQGVKAGPRAPLANPVVNWPANTFAVICYHDIQDDLLTRPDAYTVETRELALQFEWYRSNGFHMVSLDDVIASRNGGKPLPSRAILLSFDDGLESIYTRAFPLLQAFHFPAIVGLVGSWRDDPATLGQTVAYGDEKLPAGNFLTADQIKTMQASGLIEFASHTYGLHHGILANPQGNLEPAAVTRSYNADGSYESEAVFRQRVSEDLKHNSALIAKLTGYRPRVIVWPYGAYDATSEAVAAENGMPYGLTLEDGLNTPDVPLDRMRRILVTHAVATRDLAWTLEKAVRPDPIRVMHVDLDYVYDKDPKQQEANLGALLDRVKAMGVNTVYLQAYADPNGTGTASALYFPNREMPMRADLFNRVAWQLRTRCGVAVYAWLPLLAFDLPANQAAHDHWVVASDPGKGGDVKRLSPFDPAARQAITQIYQDLSNAAEFQGLLFSDDATLNDYEDSGTAALATYQQWGLPADVQAIRGNPQLRALWTQKKTQFLTDFSLQLAALVRRDHDDLMTARNVFASTVLDPASEDWVAQSYPEALQSYDYVAIMAMPYMEGHADHPKRWLANLVQRALQVPGASTKTVFELQAVDWAHANQSVSSAELAREMDTLRLAGGDSFGYYPDDFPGGLPTLDVVEPVLSAKSFPGNN